MPAGSDPGAGSLSGLTLFPGVYTAAGGSFMIQGGDLTLDAKGDANAVWVFQMATLSAQSFAATREELTADMAPLKSRL